MKVLASTDLAGCLALLYILHQRSRRGHTAARKPQRGPGSPLSRARRGATTTQNQKRKSCGAYSTFYRNFAPIYISDSELNTVTLTPTTGEF